MKLDVQTLAGKKSGSVELNDTVFGNEPRVDILHRMVRYQLAKRRSGTHQTQERGDVSKTTKRIGRQKGGGTARHGNGSVSQFRGGAKAHGPVTGASVDENFAKAANNIPNLDVLSSAGANVYDILKRHQLVLTKEAVADLEARLS